MSRDSNVADDYDGLGAHAVNANLGDAGIASDFRVMIVEAMPIRRHGLPQP